MTKWTDERDAWVVSVSPDALLGVIAGVADLGRLDENVGDATETRETILWLATRGRLGREWGIAANPAADFGGWSRG